MSDQESNRQPRTILSEGILIAIASSGAYLLAFYYEKGFTSYFEIPINLVSVSFVNIFVFAGLLIGFLLFLFFPANILPMILYKLPPALSRSAFVLLISSLGLFVHLYLFGLSNWRILVVYICLMIAFAFIELVMPMIVHRKKGSYLEKLEAQHERDRKEVTLIDIIVKRLGQGSFFIFLALLIGISFSENAGKEQATSQTDFLVTSTSPELVVLRIYGDNMICAPFNRDTKEVQTRFTIIKMADDSKLAFNLEKVGPLRPVRFESVGASISQPTPAPANAP